MEAKFVHDCLVIDGFMSDEECDAVIEDFNVSVRNNLVVRSTATARADDALDYNESASYLAGGELFAHFTEKFWNTAWFEYCKRYPILHEMEKNYGEDFGLFKMRIQKTEPTQGFHVFHFENARRVHFGRMAVFTVYLNDVPEGGETEFLYKSLRVEAKKGRLVLWPSDWTYLHRGNPPLSGTKYIMTGWVEAT